MLGISETVGLDYMVMIKEEVEISKKYNKCASVEDDKKRLAFFDNLTNSINRERK